MPGYGNCRFHLLIKVCLIYISVVILDRMVVGVTVMWISEIITMIILVLNCRHYSILTEWTFITSGTASSNFRGQVYRIRVGSDNIAQQLLEIGVIVYAP